MTQLKIFAILVPVLVWLGLALWAIADWVTPNTFWITVSKLYVQDSTSGQAPVVLFDWTVHRRVLLRWHVTVRKVSDKYDSQFTSYCTTDGQAMLNKDRRLPKQMDMDWWMLPTKCDWSPGSYYFETVWTWREFGIDREMTLQSNVFHIK